MTDNATAFAPGWYPDPSNEKPLRWYDGRVWTRHVSVEGGSAPAVRPEGGKADAAPSLPVGSKVYTTWIWVLAALPLVSYPFAAVLDYAERSGAGWLPSDLTWVVALGFAVWFAVLDFRALGDLGYSNRFSWAWVILAISVYPIGRSIRVAREAGGRGLRPLWITLAGFAVLVAIWFVQAAGGNTYGFPISIHTSHSVSHSETVTVG
ncbi:DUF2510 domain-containing protein [Agromyces protaetiae]|uniref:DUF2510 domain-containing protein n=1 Tax=Agromyces protaetiae TaxID=2509455 RepID=UPI0013EBA4D5|nr:DUF2510 domain-containing protein [Agromyces protaetiae]